MGEGISPQFPSLCVLCYPISVVTAADDRNPSGGPLTDQHSRFPGLFREYFPGEMVRARGSCLTPGSALVDHSHKVGEWDGNCRGILLPEA